MTAPARHKWRNADMQQIAIARAFGYDGFRLEAALKLPAPKPIPVATAKAELERLGLK